MYCQAKRLSDTSFHAATYFRALNVRIDLNTLRQLWKSRDHPFWFCANLKEFVQYLQINPSAVMSTNQSLAAIVEQLITCCNCWTATIWQS